MTLPNAFKPPSSVTNTVTANITSQIQQELAKSKLDYWKVVDDWRQAVGKPGAMYYFTNSQGEGRKLLHPEAEVLQTRNYWDEPQRLIRVNELIRNAPQGWQPPDWLDVEGVRDAYRYLEYRNGGRPYDEWLRLPEDDPGRELIYKIQRPPDELIHPEEQDKEWQFYNNAKKFEDYFKERLEQYNYEKQLNQEQDYQDALKQEMLSDIKTNFDDLPAWQQVLLATTNKIPTENLSNVPEYVKGTQAITTGARAALGAAGITSLFWGMIGSAAASALSGTIAGTVLGVPGNIIGGVVGASIGLYTGIQAYQGKPVAPWLDSIFHVFNMPAEWTERQIGLQILKGKGVDIDSLTREEKQIANLTYDVGVIPISNVMVNTLSQVTGALGILESTGQVADLSAGEVWAFEQGYVEPVSAYNGLSRGDALVEALLRIQTGKETYDDIYWDMVQRFGYTGTRNDFVAQNFLDPMQVMPYAVNTLGLGIAKATHAENAVKAFQNTRGNLAADVLPMGWQQIVTAVAQKAGIDFKGTAGIFDTWNQYKLLLLDNASSSLKSGYFSPLDYNKFQKWAIGMEDTGRVARYLPDSMKQSIPTTRLGKVINYLSSMDYESRAITILEWTKENVDRIVQGTKDPKDMHQMMMRLADNIADVNDASTFFVDTPITRTSSIALKDFINDRDTQTMQHLYEIAEPKRQLLIDWARRLDTDPETLVQMMRDRFYDDIEDMMLQTTGANNQYFRRIMQNNHALDPTGNITIPGRQAMRHMMLNEFDPFIFRKTFWDAQEYKVHYLDRLENFTNKFLIKNYNLDNRHWVIRLSKLFKTAQSLFLLGLNPRWAIINPENNLTNTVLDGAVGFNRPKDIDAIINRYELFLPERVSQIEKDLGISGEIIGVKGDDVLSRLTHRLSKFNRSVGVFGKLSNWLEDSMGRNAVIQQFSTYWKSNWDKDTGYMPMPDDVVTGLTALGINPDVVYKNVNRAANHAELDALKMAMQQQPPPAPAPAPQQPAPTPAQPVPQQPAPALTPAPQQAQLVQQPTAQQAQPVQQPAPAPVETPTPETIARQQLVSDIVDDLIIKLYPEGDLPVGQELEVYIGLERQIQNVLDLYDGDVDSAINYLSKRAEQSVNRQHVTDIEQIRQEYSDRFLNEGVRAIPEILNEWWYDDICFRMSLDAKKDIWMSDYYYFRDLGTKEGRATANRIFKENNSNYQAALARHNETRAARNMALLETLDIEDATSQQVISLVYANEKLYADAYAKQEEIFSHRGYTNYEHANNEIVNLWSDTYEKIGLNNDKLNDLYKSIFGLNDELNKIIDTIHNEQTTLKNTLETAKNNFWLSIKDETDNTVRHQKYQELLRTEINKLYAEYKTKLEEQILKLPDDNLVKNRVIMPVLNDIDAINAEFEYLMLETKYNQSITEAEYREYESYANNLIREAAIELFLKDETPEMQAKMADAILLLYKQRANNYTKNTGRNPLLVYGEELYGFGKIGEKDARYVLQTFEEFLNKIEPETGIPETDINTEYDIEPKKVTFAEALARHKEIEAAVKAKKLKDIEGTKPSLEIEIEKPVSELDQRNEIIKEAKAKGKLEVAGMLSDKYYKEYGGMHNEGITATNTYDAVKSGERTAQTFFKSTEKDYVWAQKKKAYQTGKTIVIDGEGDTYIYAVITKGLHKLIPETDADAWCKKEGWNRTYFDTHIKPKIESGDVYQIEFAYLDFEAKLAPVPEAIAETPRETRSGKAIHIKDVETETKPAYEVSSKGDKRFSALNAKLADGRTIEEHYQVDYKGYNSIKAGKGKPPRNNDTPEQSYQAYKALWRQYFDENPDQFETIKEIASTHELKDSFAKTDINQARAITDIINETSVPEQITEQAEPAAPTAPAVPTIQDIAEMPRWSEVEYRELKETIGASGSTTWMEDGRALLRASEAADFQTFVHELLHVWSRRISDDDLSVLIKAAIPGMDIDKYRVLIDKQQRKLFKKNDPDRETLRRIDEAIVNAATRYMMERDRDYGRLEPIMNDIKSWLIDIYERMGYEMGISFSDEIEDMFEKVITNDREVINQKMTRKAIDARSPYYDVAEIKLLKEGTAPENRAAIVRDIKRQLDIPNEYKFWWEDNPDIIVVDANDNVLIGKDTKFHPGWMKKYMIGFKREENVSAAPTYSEGINKIQQRYEEPKTRDVYVTKVDEVYQIKRKWQDEWAMMGVPEEYIRELLANDYCPVVRVPEIEKVAPVKTSTPEAVKTYPKVYFEPIFKDYEYKLNQYTEAIKEALKLDPTKKNAPVKEDIPLPVKRTKEGTRIANEITYPPKKTPPIAKSDYDKMKEILRVGVWDDTKHWIDKVDKLEKRILESRDAGKMTQQEYAELHSRYVTMHNTLIQHMKDLNALFYKGKADRGMMLKREAITGHVNRTWKKTPKVPVEPMNQVDIAYNFKAYGKNDISYRPDIKFIFTENLQAYLQNLGMTSKIDEIGLPHPEKIHTNINSKNTQSFARTDSAGYPNENAFGLIIKKYQQNDAGSFVNNEGYWQDTDADFELFTKYNSMVLDKLQADGRPIKFVSENIDVSILPPKFVLWLKDELKSRLDIDTEIHYKRGNKDGYLKVVIPDNVAKVEMADVDADLEVQRNQLDALKLERLDAIRNETSEVEFLDDVIKFSLDVTNHNNFLKEFIGNNLIEYKEAAKIFFDLFKRTKTRRALHIQVSDWMEARIKYGNESIEALEAMPKFIKQYFQNYMEYRNPRRILDENLRTKYPGQEPLYELYETLLQFSYTKDYTYTPVNPITDMMNHIVPALALYLNDISPAFRRLTKSYFELFKPLTEAEADAESKYMVRAGKISESQSKRLQELRLERMSKETREQLFKEQKRKTFKTDIREKDRVAPGSQRIEELETWLEENPKQEPEFPTYEPLEPQPKFIFKQPPNTISNYPAVTHINYGRTPAAPFPKMGAVMDEMNTSHILPMLNMFKQEYKARTKGTNLDVNPITRGEEFPLESLPPTRAVRTTNNMTAQKFNDWIDKVKIEMDEEKRIATRYAVMMRDTSMHNYNERNNIDNIFDFAFPYQFWFTREIGKWAKRALQKPGIISYYYRRNHMLERNGMYLEEEDSTPKRIMGKMKIPWVFKEPWMGDAIYINPWADLMPINNLTQPIQLLDMAAQSVNPMLELDKMVKSREITQQEADNAILNKKGDIWDLAKDRAIETNAQEMGDPMTIMSMMLSPSLILQTTSRAISNAITGEDRNVLAGTLPVMKTAMSLVAIGDSFGLINGGKLVPKKNTTKNEIAWFGEWGDWLLDRSLTNMAAQPNAKNWKEIYQALLNHEGEHYNEALRRLMLEVSLKQPGTLLADKLAQGDLNDLPFALIFTLMPASIFPASEMEMLGLKDELSVAWEARANGYSEPLTRFFDEHPEYYARAALNDEPEMRYKKFMVTEIMGAYHDLNSYNKVIIKKNLGEEFVDKLLDTADTSGIDYDDLDYQQLTEWAQRLNGYIIDAPEEISDQINKDILRTLPEIELFTEDEIATIETYYEQRDKLYPESTWMNADYWALPEDERKDYLNRFPKLQKYWAWNKQFKIEHPIMEEWLEVLSDKSVTLPQSNVTQEPRTYYGIDANFIDGIKEEKNKLFPDYNWKQIIYFNLPGADVDPYYQQRDRLFPNYSRLNTDYWALPEAERKGYLNANPELKAAWEWGKKYKQTTPIKKYSSPKKDFLQHNPDLLAAWDWDEMMAMKYPDYARYKELAKEEFETKAAQTEVVKLAQAQGNYYVLSNIHEFARLELSMYKMTGQELSEGAKDEINRYYIKLGKPEQTLEEYIDSLIKY